VGSLNTFRFGEKVIKLLGIVGSPRKGGNTEIIMKEALKAGEQEGAETELINLVDFNLKPCDACRICFETQNCAINDDVEKIFQKMTEADAIIIGSPVYFANVNAQTKTFIDRVGYLNTARGRKAFRNKVGGAIAVARRSGLTNTLSQILLFLNATRMITASPSVRILAREKGDATKDTEGIEAARDLGKSIVQIAKATALMRGA
jgi:multimeric flavodoxin WrbA